MRITGEQRPAYYAFASAALKTKFTPAYDTRIITKLDDAGMPLGCIVYAHITDKNLEMMVALPFGAPGLCREFMYRMFAYPFLQLRLPHITTLADEANEKSIRLTEHAGFVREGRMRRVCNGRDAIIYGMCRDECRWIGPRFRELYHE